MVKRLLLAFFLLAPSLSLASSTTSASLAGNARRSLMTERSERMSEEASWHNCLCHLLPLHTVFVLCLVFLNANRVLLYELSYLCPKIFYFVGILSVFCRISVGFLSGILNSVGFLSVFCRFFVGIILQRISKCKLQARQRLQTNRVLTSLSIIACLGVPLIPCEPLRVYFLTRCACPTPYSRIKNLSDRSPF